MSAGCEAPTGPSQNLRIHKIFESRIFTNQGKIKLGRTRTPTALLELRGAFKRNPNRRRPNEPLVTEPLPEAPRRLPKDIRIIWNEMRDRGFWLSSADRFLVEIAATLMQWHREDQPKVTPVLIATLAKLGFSPKSRAALGVNAAKTAA
jgi:hypothetical protein